MGGASASSCFLCGGLGGKARRGGAHPFRGLRKEDPEPSAHRMRVCGSEKPCRAREPPGVGTSAPALPGRVTSHTPTRAVALGGASLDVRWHRVRERACCGHLWRRAQALQAGGHYASPHFTGVISFIACPILAACKRQPGAPPGWEAGHTECPRWPAVAGRKRVLRGPTLRCRC